MISILVLVLTIASDPSLIILLILGLIRHAIPSEADVMWSGARNLHINVIPSEARNLQIHVIPSEARNLTYT